MTWIGKILLWFLATVGGIVTVITAAVITFTVSVRDDVPPLPDQAVLSLDWNKPIPENLATLPLFEQVPPATLLETLQALEAAAQAPQVKALVVQLGSQPMDFARAQELADAVRRFRLSGKPTFAYADDFAAFGDGTPEIMLAAAFDTVWMAPSGTVGLTGVALEMPYAAEALESLGIEPEFEQRHEYKGGGDPLTKRGMPTPVRESLGALADGMLAEAVSAIASGRDLSRDAVQTLVDTGPHLGRDAVSSGLIDGLKYWSDAERVIMQQTSIEADWIDAPHLLAAASAQESEPVEGGDPPRRVAVLYGLGPIGVAQEDDPFNDSGFASNTLIETLGEIADSGEYDAVLFRVDSPGGAYGPSDGVWNAVRELQEAGIPVVVSMGSVAASGGYFVSTSADRIVAQPTTITGSIGVYGGKFDASALWDTLGVNWERVSAGQNAGMWSLNRGFDTAERERFAALIDFVYEDFTTKVAEGRGFDAEALDAIARGRVWSGTAALEVGLVDSLGGLFEAKGEIRALLGLTAQDPPLILDVLPEPKEPWQAFVEAAQSGEYSMAVDRLVAGAVERQVSTRIETLVGDLDWILHQGGILTMPPIRVTR